MANMSRRNVLRYGAVGAMTAATAAVGLQGPAVGSAAGPQEAAAVDPGDVDEVYKGKRIEIEHNAAGMGVPSVQINNKTLAVATVVTLFVPEDGSKPYVGVGYITAINHYDPVEVDDDKNRDGLRKLARKVVDILGESELTDEAAKAHH